MTDHYSFEHLLDFVEDRLLAEERAELEAHLASGCDACNAEVATTRRLLLALEVGQWPKPSPEARRQAQKTFKQTIERKSRLRPVFRLALAGGLLLVALLIIMVSPWAPEEAFAASLIDVTGPVTVELSPEGISQPAVEGQSIPVGASVQTKSGANAILLFPNGVRTNLGEDTRIELSVLKLDKKGWQIVVSQARGQTESEIEADMTHYVLQTRAGQVVAGGTRFLVRIEESGMNFVRVSEGQVEIITATNAIQLSTGMMAQFSPAQGAALVTSTPTEDSEIESEIILTSTPTPQEALSSPTVSATEEADETPEATESPDEGEPTEAQESGD